VKVLNHNGVLKDADVSVIMFVASNETGEPPKDVPDV
jgi:hypothetical protein